MKMPTDLIFQKPVTFPPLAPGEIHIWSSRLISKTSNVDDFHFLLSNEERSRAANFYHDLDRVKYILSHGYLRLLLGKYVHQNPKELILFKGEQGKPFIKSAPVKFNLSHAGELAIFAFCLDEDLGVDIEVLRVIPEAGDIIKRLFSAREKWIFSLTPKNRKAKVFLTFWTRGEALVKAVGSGFGVKVGGIIKATVSRDGKSWKIKSFIPDPGYVGAIVVPRNSWKISCWQVVNDIILPTETQLTDHKGK